MTEADRKALSALATFDSLVRPGFFGLTLWPHNHRMPQSLARSSGRVLNRLKARGLAEWLVTGPDRAYQWGWRITPEGRRALKTMPGAGEDRGST